jgi:hypothetical protein
MTVPLASYWGIAPQLTPVPPGVATWVLDHGMGDWMGLFIQA